jgi:flagellar basal-body rod protein FlgB
MTNSIDEALGLHTQALILRSRRAEVLAANLANADTPNYLAKDLDFGTLLAQAQDSVTMKVSHGVHISNAGTADSALMYRIPLQPAVDGNTVDTQLEKAQFLENALHYQASLQFLDGRIKTLVTAIRGE